MKLPADSIRFACGWLGCDSDDNHKKITHCWAAGNRPDQLNSPLMKRIFFKIATLSLFHNRAHETRAQRKINSMELGVKKTVTSMLEK